MPCPNPTNCPTAGAAIFLDCNAIAYLIDIAARERRDDGSGSGIGNLRSVLHDLIGSLSSCTQRGVFNTSRHVWQDEIHSPGVNLGLRKRELFLGQVEQRHPTVFPRYQSMIRTELIGYVRPDTVPDMPLFLEQLKRLVRNPDASKTENDLSLIACLLHVAANQGGGILITDDEDLKTAAKEVLSQSSIIVGPNRYRTTNIACLGLLAFSSKLYDCCAMTRAEYERIFEYMIRVAMKLHAGTGIMNLKIQGLMMAHRQSVDAALKKGRMRQQMAGATT